MKAPFPGFCSQLEAAEKALDDAADRARPQLINMPGSEYAKQLQAEWIAAETAVQRLLEQIKP